MARSVAQAATSARCIVMHGGASRCSHLFQALCVRDGRIVQPWGAVTRGEPSSVTSRCASPHAPTTPLALIVRRGPSQRRVRPSCVEPPAPTPPRGATLGAGDTRDERERPGPRGVCRLPGDAGPRSVQRLCARYHSTAAAPPTRCATALTPWSSGQRDTSAPRSRHDVHAHHGPPSCWGCPRSHRWGR
jgi:hypothetical protein